MEWKTSDLSRILIHGCSCCSASQYNLWCTFAALRILNSAIEFRRRLTWIRRYLLSPAMLRSALPKLFHVNAAVESTSVSNGTRNFLFSIIAGFHVLWRLISEFRRSSAAVYVTPCLSPLPLQLLRCLCDTDRSERTAALRPSIIRFPCCCDNVLFLL